jgi:very-short-patch-repair endonuclease
VVFPVAKLVVELGVDELEPTPERAARERERQSRLAAAGWAVVRYTWADLTTRPTEVVAEMRSLLDRLAPTRW